MNWFNKILFIIIDFPTSFVRDLTIPPCELKRWNRTFFTLFPIMSITFILLVTNLIWVVAYNVYITIGVAIFLVLVCVLINQFTYRNRLPPCVLVNNIININKT